MIDTESKRTRLKFPSGVSGLVRSEITSSKPIAVESSYHYLSFLPI